MSSSTSTQPSAKQRQLEHLARQLQQLAQNTEELAQLTVTTAEQASYMRLLGGFHASWFMAAGRIMTPGEAPPPAQE